MSNSLINAVNLSVFKDDNELLKGINWSLEEGEWHHITGPNKSGKSSLINALLYDHSSCKGQLSLLGYSMLPLARENMNFIRQRIGLSEQSPFLLFNKTVRINMLMPLQSLERFDSNEAEEKIVELLREFTLEHLLKREVNRLSFSEIHIISFLCSIIHKPKLLLLDGTLDALDINWKPLVLDKLQKLCTKDRMGVLVTAIRDPDLEIPSVRALKLSDGILSESKD